MTGHDDDERTHFESFRSRCEPILAWVEERFGVCQDRSCLWRYIRVEKHGISLKVNLEDTAVEWVTGMDGKWHRAGWTAYPVWDTKTPVGVLMAAELVKHRGGL